MVVVHDCEGNYAGSIAWFAQARSRVSAHLVLKDDGLEATQMVSWANKAWHACDFNPFSEGIEAAGFAAKGFAAPEWDALAALTAWRLHANGLPCQEASAANDWTGFTEHAKLGAAGGGHHDLTEDSQVWQAFVARVQKAYANAAPAAPVLTAASVPAMPGGYTPSGTTRHDLPHSSIAWAQAELNALGFAAPLLIVDDLDGPATQYAMRAFQAHAAIGVDGQYGPETQAALERAA
jgi:N-acetyl-anhydromuramyl-L-alanine amidase AmpD